MTKNPMAFLSLFIAGALLMFLFDHWFTLLLGMALQLAAVVVGVFTIAQPEFLERDAASSAAKPDPE